MTNLLKKVLLMLAITVIIFSLASCQVLEMLPDEVVDVLEKIPGLDGVIGGDEHVHAFGDATCTTPATCECGETEGEALGHSFVDGKCACGEEDPDYVPHEHTFVEGKCECGASDPNYVPPHVHSYETVVTAPTCTEAGYTTYTCACGDSYKADETAALGHTYEAVVTAPTCTEAGYTTHTCSCGDKKITDRTAALGHNYDFVVTAPTCTEAGYTTYTCACGDVYVGNEVAATGHAFAPATCTAPATCHCGATEGEALGHKYLFECDAHCMVCGEFTNENAAHSIIFVDYVEATCFENGNNAYYTCEYCGNCWLDEELTQVTNRMSEIIPMIGEHVYEENFWYHPELVSATCCATGTGVMECIYCGDYYTFETDIDPYGHELDWENVVVVTPADCSTMTDAVLNLTCTLCGTVVEQTESAWHTMEEEYIPATCTENGSYYGICTVCGYVDSYVIEAGGHYNWYLSCGQTGECMECFIEFTVEHDLSWFPATCTSPAICFYCDAVVGEALGHSYVNGFCEVCGEADSAHEHNFAPATCTTPATCECGETEGEALGHSYMFACDAHCMVCGEFTNEDAAHSITLVKGTPATCTVDGVADVYTCNHCNYGWLDEELTIIANRMSIVLYATGHDFDAANCTSPKTCAICDETEGEALGHADDNGDFKCDRCSTKVLPAANEALTIAQAIALGKLYTKDTYTSDKYYITGIITEVQNTQYGNLVISDGTNSILVYGLYSYDGKTRYDAMSYKPVPGDEITVWGVIGYYTDAQMKNGWMDEVVQHSHEYADATCEAPATCTLCGLTQGEKADHNYVDGTCTMCGNSEGVTIVEKTLSFSNKSNRTTYTTSQQVWEQNGVTLTNDKSSSTSNVGDYYNPARFYKSSKITIDCAGMTKIVFVCNSSSYASALNSSIGTVSGATVTVSGSNVTVEFDAPVDTFVIANLSGGQVRVNSLTVYAAE